MTTVGFVSGTREETAPSRCSRFAAAASLLLGGVIVLVLPDLVDAAFYVGVLFAAAAGVAIVAGSILWTRATLVARTVAGLAAAATLFALLLQVSLGLPGVQQLALLSPLEGVLTFGFAGAVLLFLVADALLRTPEQAPDHPYAL